ncbi:MAG: Fe(3+)-hydroxamate ABC transporter permease FhuB [Rhizobiaceae bacterium]|nr:Fe(3+)-hydroxamate ABC transporter permease FhuB [Rhizobiaceae bacterium]
MIAAPTVKPFVPALCLIVLAAALSIHGIELRLPVNLWSAVISHPDLTDPRQLVVLYSMLPRAALAILSGAALALAGSVFQQVMRNPLAEPATLGTSAGAYLALTIGTLLVPGLVGAGRELFALVGGLAATLLVFFLALRRGLAPGLLVLAGLIVTFACGSLTSVLLLYANPYDLSLYLWGAGSLSQNDWSAVNTLLPRLLGCIILIALLARSLTILGLDDATAHSIGLPVFSMRLLSLSVAVYLSVAVVCAVGAIGFVGLIAPAVARFAGARTPRMRLISSALTGAGLLWLTDQLLLLGATSGREFLPTGAATALLGTPVLLLILMRGQLPADPPRDSAVEIRRATRPWRLIAGLVCLLILFLLVALDFARGIDGWAWAGPRDVIELLAWRGPRTIGAASAGAILALSGSILQRLTGNDMASPEVLGLGGAASLALAILLLAFPTAGLESQLAAMLLGALVAVATLLALGRHFHFNPERLLISGVAIAALANVLVVAALSTGLPALARLKIWMAGATDQLTAQQAGIAAAFALFFALATPLLRRWLEILPLGQASAQAMGVRPRRAQLILMLWAALLTAAATLLIGPLGFIGLMAPRLAALSGLRSPTSHLLGAAAIGALIMIIADWLGRTLLFPYEIPAGLMASLIATPYFVWLLWSRA